MEKFTEMFRLAQEGKLSTLPPTAFTLSDMLDPENGVNGVCPLEESLDSILIGLCQSGEKYNPSSPAGNMEEQVVHWILEGGSLRQKNAAGDNLLEFLHRSNIHYRMPVEFDELLQVTPGSDIPEELCDYFTKGWWEEHEARGADMSL
jgi:hypothetical protein